MPDYDQPIRGRHYDAGDYNSSLSIHREETEAAVPPPPVVQSVDELYRSFSSLENQLRQLEERLQLVLRPELEKSEDREERIPSAPVSGLVAQLNLLITSVKRQAQTVVVLIDRLEV